MKKFMFVVLEDVYNKDHGFQACIIHEGLEGICPTDQFFGHDYELASEIATDKNIALGLTKEEQSRMICMAMGFPEEGARA